MATCANEAVPQWGKHRLINGVYLPVCFKLLIKLLSCGVSHSDVCDLGDITFQSVTQSRGARPFWDFISRCHRIDEKDNNSVDLSGLHTHTVFWSVHRDDKRFHFYDAGGARGLSEGGPNEDLHPFLWYEHGTPFSRTCLNCWTSFLLRL